MALETMTPELAPAETAEPAPAGVESPAIPLYNRIERFNHTGKVQEFKVRPVSPRSTPAAGAAASKREAAGAGSPPGTSRSSRARSCWSSSTWGAERPVAAA
ncbi:hypothetical protein [Streptomyces sp. AF1A]|uniref:hypothetical protein n=1 Tax=Streptomyces sp. AF1A TaxID=3394350 RepID=UPI0039BD021F